VNTLACIVNYSIDNGGVPSIERLGEILGVVRETARKRKAVLVKRGYLLSGDVRGKYKINHSLFCTTRLTARVLILYREIKRNGFVDESVLLEEAGKIIFSGVEEHAVSTLDKCLKIGYLSRHEDRATHIEEGCLDEHYEYLLLIGKGDQ
jgi:hypothetical protein